MGVNPSDISRTLSAAKALRANSKYGTPEGLLLAYVAWEGLKIRILAVGLAQQGWRFQTFKSAISDLELWRSKNYELAFASVFGQKPQNTKNLGKIWSRVATAERLRNKFVHGLGQTHPDTIEKSYRFLIEIIEDRSWLDNLSVKLPGGETEALNSLDSRITARSNRQPNQISSRLVTQLMANRKSKTNY